MAGSRGVGGIGALNRDVIYELIPGAGSLIDACMLQRAGSGSEALAAAEVIMTERRDGGMEREGRKGEIGRENRRETRSNENGEMEGEREIQESEAKEREREGK